MVLVAVAPLVSEGVRVVRRFLLEVGLPSWVPNLLFSALKVAAILAFITLNVLFLVWLERKVSARFQSRRGPNRTGPVGLLQTIADTFKLLAKEDVVPAAADPWVFAIAPFVAFIPALLVFVVVPFGKDLIVSDLNIGILYVAAVTSFTIISFLLAGWGSNSKWSLLGGMRAAAQLVSYEVPLVLSVIGVVMLAGSLSLASIVDAQRQGLWFILLQPIGFAVYLTATLAELNRAPFDLTEAESELVAGFNVEYSGLRWSFFFLAEYANLFSLSAIAVTLYFGGWNGPFLPPFAWFLIKTYILIFVVMWIRWTLPRIRVDQFMELGWKVLVPLALLNIGVTGAVVLAR